MSFSKRMTTIATIAGSLMLSTAAYAAEGQPFEWQMGLQNANSPVMGEISDFMSLLHWISVIIAVFVTILLGYVMVRFSAKRNPVPSKTSHNTLLEVLWTVIPIMILVVIAIPSFKLLYFQDRAANPELTIKAIGHQWYWSYEYPDNGDFTFDSLMLAEDELEKGQPRLLATDTNVVVPVDTEIRLLVTADDVLHAWAMPSFGVKIDAVPGRINETWFKAPKEGIYYGQCSELCGVNHGFMPIAVKVVSKAEYAKWVETAKEEYARVGAPEPMVAEAATPARPTAAD